jgi:hypothetical protein
MNFKWLSVVAAAVLSLTAVAENLIVNGDFTQMRGALAVNWVKVGKADIAFQKYENRSCVVFSGNNTKGACSLRQSLAKKAFPGKKYRLSAAVRGENFQAADYGVLLINTNWRGNVGIRRFQLRSDGQWRNLSKVVTVPGSWTSVTAVIFTVDQRGKFYVADFRCEPVAE